MHTKRERRFRIFCLLPVVLCFALSGHAGVSRAIQDQYKRDYENKALFLRVPIYAERQIVYVNSRGTRVDPGIGSPRFKVGDQLRILMIDFAGDEIKFRMSGISTPGPVEIIYRFESGLQEDFPNKEAFDRAIRSTFTEGLKYTEIEDAKRSFVEDQFERSVKEIASSASISQESVLKSIAPQVPAYREAQRDIDGLKSRVQDVSSQLSQSQAENRKLESESRAQQAEVARLKSANTALQNKIDESASQMNRLGDELRDAKGSAQGYQKELANIQRSLNLRVDSTRDLSSQIADLGQTLRRLQKDNETLTNQAGLLRANLDAQQAANALLLGENEDLKSKNSRMQGTISTLTSKEGSLAKQYLNLKNEKEKLDDFAKALAALRVRVEEEKAEGGFHSGKANVYLSSVLLGSLSWNIPMHLSHEESKNGEATFAAESIDYVRINPEERFLLRTLGTKLKMRVDLTSVAATMAVTPEADKAPRVIGERESASWRWNIVNQGTQDARLTITARLINRNSREIPVYQQETTILASNAVRQIRSYLQPIPLIVGLILGFLLFGIVGIFRHPKKQGGRHRETPSTAASDPSSYVDRKKL